MDEDAFRWPGSHEIHRFHATCLAQRRPVREALAHFIVTGDILRIATSTCPSCRRFWGDSVDAGVEGERLATMLP